MRADGHPLTLHFADSELARVVSTPEGCCLVLAAARVRGPRGEGWVRGLQVRLAGCRPSASELAALLPGRLQDAELLGPAPGAGPVPGVVALPGDLPGPLTLTLHGPYQSRLVLRAQRLTVARPPDDAVHDTLAC